MEAEGFLGLLWGNSHHLMVFACLGRALIGILATSGPPGGYSARILHQAHQSG